MEQTVESLINTYDINVGKKYTWTRYAYVVEVKQKDRDLCKVVILSAPKRKDPHPTSIGTYITVLQKDLRKMPANPS